ncbi:MAG: hypothetical protein PVG65_07000 [Candidatus Thorarchaeota archaeon]|jgi:hypothetical protein
MRKAKLIKEFRELGGANGTWHVVCEFHRTIEILDVPPIGYTIIFPQPEIGRYGRMYIRHADIESKNGNLNLYGVIEIPNYENRDGGVKIIKKMHKEGWEVKKVHEDVITEVRGII